MKIEDINLKTLKDSTKNLQNSKILYERKSTPPRDVIRLINFGLK